MIKVLVPDMPTADDLLPYLRLVDGQRWYTNFGGAEQELRRQLSWRLSGAEIVTVGNATQGLELALTVLKLPRGSRVLTPAFTFPATATAIVRAGLVPVFADVDERTWLLTPASAKPVIDYYTAWVPHRVKAVVPVCALGAGHDLYRWAEVGRLVPVVIDAAAALGSQRGTHPAVPLVFSLHATKSLGAGEGGFIALDRELTNYAEQLRQLTNFGFDADRHAHYAEATNAKLSEYHALVALAALNRWEETSTKRRWLADTYDYFLRGNQHLTFQQRPIDDVRTTYEVLLPRGTDLVTVQTRLRENGIETRRWYWPPLHLQPAFADYATLANLRGLAGDLPVTTDLANRLLGLPFHTRLSEADVDYICSTLKGALQT